MKTFPGPPDLALQTMGKVRGQFNVGFTDKQNGMGKEEAFSSIYEFVSPSPSEQLNWSMNPKKRRKSEID